MQFTWKENVCIPYSSLTIVWRVIFLLYWFKEPCKIDSTVLMSVTISDVQVKRLEYKNGESSCGKMLKEKWKILFQHSFHHYIENVHALKYKNTFFYLNFFLIRLSPYINHLFITIINAKKKTNNSQGKIISIYVNKRAEI